ETVEQGAHRFLDAQVVHLDAPAREAAHLGPGGALVERLRLDRRRPEQAIVLVEAGEDAARDVLRQARAPLVQRDDLRRARHTAASFAFFLSSKNCSSSVEPCSAVVEAAPPVTTCVISSK